MTTNPSTNVQINRDFDNVQPGDTVIYINDQPESDTGFIYGQGYTVTNVSAVGINVKGSHRVMLHTDYKII